MARGRELKVRRTAIRLEREYNLNVTAQILLNGEFTFCPIHDFNELSMAKIAHKQLWRDEPSRQSLNCIVRTDS